MSKSMISFKRANQQVGDYIQQFRVKTDESLQDEYNQKLLHNVLGNLKIANKQVEDLIGQIEGV